MKAWIVDRPGAIDDGPLTRVERAIPEPESNEIRVRVTACGVCRTTQRYSLDHADAALRDLALDRVTGAAVLVP